LEKGIHITSVCWYKIYPAITGGQKGIALFNEALQSAYNFTCICSSNNKVSNGLEENILPILPQSKLQFLNFFNYKKVLKIVKEKQSRFVIIEHPYYWPLSFFKRKYDFNLILHSHNIEYKRAQARGKWFWRLIFLWEKWAHQKSDIILFKTEEDKRFAQRKFSFKNNQTYTFPYCTNIAKLPTDKDFCKEKVRAMHQLDATTKILLFAASFDYEPNQKGLLHLINDIIPELKNQVSNFKILLCGIGLEKFINEHKLTIPKECITVGAVEDMTLYFKAADVFVNPITIGEGIQTKNIDALANNCTVVGYKSVANGVTDYVIDKKAFFANTNKTIEFVSLIKKALEQELADINAQFYKDFSWKEQISLIFLNFESA
jgi:polysaccharide biosynthesis protein PslH